MRIIDAYLGRDVKVGEVVPSVYHPYELLAVDEGLFSAIITIRSRGLLQKIKMPVRYMHPSFLFQRVVFVPT